MRRVFALMLLTAASFTAAWAHPLGNFSINQYSSIEPRSGSLRIIQILDMAEIPTFQAMAEIDRNADGEISEEEISGYMERLSPAYVAGLQLEIDGVAVPLTVTREEAAALAGEGGLPIAHLRWELSAELSSGSQSEVFFANRNYAERIGWNEIVVTPGEGINVYNSTAYGSSLTDELRSFPAERIQSPLSERTAAFSFTGGTIPDGARPLAARDGKLAEPVTKDRLAELIAVPVITPYIALIGLLIAFGLGAVHAMSPGHGKAVVGAYLVGTKGTPRHAALLGLTVTVTHTLGVFALGFLTLVASRYILPETLMPLLSFASGLIVLYIGLAMFRRRLIAALDGSSSVEHGHDETIGEHAHDDAAHTHLPPEDLSPRNLLALGVSGGLLPCPSALVLMLSAINLERVGYGLVLTTAFSLGLASTLTAVGLAFLYGGRLFDGESLRRSRAARVVPVLSALIIACLGAVICYRSL